MGLSRCPPRFSFFLQYDKFLNLCTKGVTISDKNMLGPPATVKIYIKNFLFQVSSPLNTLFCKSCGNLLHVRNVCTVQVGCEFFMWRWRNWRVFIYVMPSILQHNFRAFAITCLHACVPVRVYLYPCSGSSSCWCPCWCRCKCFFTVSLSVPRPCSNPHAHIYVHRYTMNKSP